jgi:hypothetical protein
MLRIRWWDVKRKHRNNYKNHHATETENCPPRNPKEPTPEDGNVH